MSALSTLRNFRTRKETNRGQASVEFALSILIIMVLVLCAWELLMAVYTSSVLADAAKEGVRYAIVHGSYSPNCSGPNAAKPCTYDPGAINVTNRVHDYCTASLHDISAITISVSYPDGTNDPPNRVTVTVSYVYQPYANLMFFQPTLTTHATGRIAN